MPDNNEIPKTENQNINSGELKPKDLLNVHKVNSEIHAEILATHGAEATEKYRQDIFDTSDADKFRQLKVSEEVAGDYKQNRLASIRDKMNKEKRDNEEKAKKDTEARVAAENIKKEMSTVYSENSLGYDEGQKKLQEIVSKDPKLTNLVTSNPAYMNDPAWVAYVLGNQKTPPKSGSTSFEPNRNAQTYGGAPSSGPTENLSNLELSQKYPVQYRKAKALFDKRYKGSAIENRYTLEFMSKFYNPE